MTSPQPAFGDYQLAIYGAGVRAELPRFVPDGVRRAGSQGGPGAVTVDPVLRRRRRGQ